MVRVNDAPLPTTFVDVRTLRAKISQSVPQAAKVTVFNKPPDGGVSNAVFLNVAEGSGPQITAINPYRVVEGSPDLDIAISGAGFTSLSVVRAGDTQIPTTFVDAHTLHARIPSDLVARALPNRFNAPGPEQNNGVYGDRTLKLSVSNGRTEEISNSVSLRIVSKWLADKKE